MNCEVCGTDCKKEWFEGKLKSMTSWIRACKSCFERYGDGIGAGKGRHLTLSEEGVLTIKGDEYGVDTRINRETGAREKENDV